MRTFAVLTSLLVVPLASEPRAGFAAFDEAPWSGRTSIAGVAAQSPSQVAKSPNRLSESEEIEGFQLLFDGKTLNGFTGYRKPQLPKGWSVIEGAIQFTPGSERGDIRTIDTFADFDLRMEWKVQPGGNSGIFWRVDETMGAPFTTGLEMQVLDNEKHSDGKNPLTSAGSSYGMYAPTKNVCRPAGQWNAVRIVAKGKRATYWMNGEKIVELEIGSEDFKERMKTVWFKPGADYGSRASGYIVLQDHGDVVAFRSIRIKKL